MAICHTIKHDWAKQTQNKGAKYKVCFSVLKVDWFNINVGWIKITCLVSKSHWK